MARLARLARHRHRRLRYRRQPCRRRRAGLGLGDRVTAAQHALSRSRPEGNFHLVYACYLRSPVPLDRDHILRDAAGRARPGGCLVVIDHGWAAPWSWRPSDGREPEFPAPEQILAGLGLGPGWETEACERAERAATGPDGQTATVGFRRLPGCGHRGELGRGGEDDPAGDDSVITLSGRQPAKRRYRRVAACDDQLARLQAARGVLSRMLECPGDGPAEACPYLAATIGEYLTAGRLRRSSYTPALLAIAARLG